MNINSAMQLKRFEIIEFHFKMNEMRPKLPDAENPENFNIDIGLDAQKNSNNPFDQRLLLEFKMHKSTDVCAIEELHFKVFGYFTFEKKMNEDELQPFLLYNGVAILYSMMRSQVLQFSALTAIPKLILPTINTRLLVENYLTNQKSNTTKKSLKN